MPRLLALLVTLLATLASVGFAQVSTTYFATIPTISPTTTLSAGHVCATDGRDIYCDGSLPLTAGLGVADRIISGSQAAIINSATGVISLTTAGTSWGYLSPNSFSYLPYLNTLGVSATGTVSATNGYFAGNVGIGTTAPTVPLSLGQGFGAAGAANKVALYDAPGNIYGFGISPVQLNIVAGVNGHIVQFTGGSERLRITPAGLVGIGTASPNAALHVSGTALFTSNTNTIGETSTTSVKIAAASGAPDATKCVGGSDYGRIVQGSNNVLYLCVPR